MKTYSKFLLAFLLLILVVPPVGADEPPEPIQASMLRARAIIAAAPAGEVRECEHGTRDTDRLAAGFGPRRGHRICCA